MATEYKLSYTGAEINEKLGKVSQIETAIADLQPKTHWIEYVEILPETTVTISDSGEAVIQAVSDITAGDTCRVTYNGVSYESVAVEKELEVIFIMLGNYGSIEDNPVDTGEPFIAAYNAPDVGGWVFMALDGSTEVTISISKQVFNKIPSEYIPENYYVYEISMDAFEMSTMLNGDIYYSAKVKEIPVALLEAMESYKPVYLKISEYLEYIDDPKMYLAPAQYSGMIEYAMTLVDRTQKMYTVSDQFDLCNINMLAYISSVIWNNYPYYIRFQSGTDDAV